MDYLQNIFENMYSYNLDMWKKMNSPPPPQKKKRQASNGVE